MADANDSNDFLRVVDFVDDAVIAETDAPAFTLGQFFATGRSGVFLQCPYLEFSDGKLLGGQISQFSLGSRQDEKAVAHFLERFISAMAWSNGTGVSPDASASSNARISSSSSSSSRSFSYSSMPITTAIFSPFSLVRNCVGSFISSPAEEVYSRRLEGAITERRTCVGTAHQISLFVAGGGYFEDGEEGFLRDVDLADALHALLAFFLFFEEFAFTADVAAVALGQNVFANGRDRLARDHATANCRLNRHLEHLPRNQFAQAGHQVAAALVRLLAMANHGQRVHRFAAHQNVELDQVGFDVTREVIIERSVAARNRFQPVVKIEHDFVQRQFVGEHDARR